MTHPVDLLWDRIEASMAERDPELRQCLRPGASRDALAWLQAVGLPEEWVRVFARHDGERDGLFLLDGYVLCPVLERVDSVSAEREAWLSLLGRFGQRQHPVAVVEGPVRALQAHDRWIPIGKDFAGNVLFVDLDPAEGGSVGQVVELDHEVGLRVRFDGAEALLRDVLARVEGGQVRVVREPGSPGGPRLITVDVPDIANLVVGRPFPLDDDGLVLLRLEASVVPGLELGEASHDLVFTLDRQHGEGGAIHKAHLTGDLRTLGAGLGQRAEWRWVHSELPLCEGLHLRLIINVDAPMEGIRPLTELRELSESGSWEGRAARGFRHRLLGQEEEALAAVTSALRVEAPAILGLEQADLLRSLGRHEEALEVVDAHLPAAVALAIRARCRLGAGQKSAGLEDLEALLDAHPETRWHLLAATLYAELGDANRAAAETERAIAALPFLQQHYKPRLSRWLERRRRATRVAASATASAPVATVDDVPTVRGDGFVRDGKDVRVTIDLTPGEAASGMTVQVDTPDGAVGVGLPAGAGDGAALRMKGLGEHGEGDLVVTVAIVLPSDFVAPEGCSNVTLSFDRWDAIAVVPAPAAGAVISVVGVREVHELTWPAGADEVRVSGAGLTRPRGTAGDLVVRVS